jgi:FtsZ-binding cell division protein ZapB
MNTEIPDEVERLRAENEQLRHRVDEAERALSALKTEALARRAEVRAFAEELPAAMSRRAVVSGLLRDLVHHPDKPGVIRRAVAKLGRAPRKLARKLHLTT